MTKEEKIQNLERLYKKKDKIMKKAYKLIGELIENDEYDGYFNKLDYAKKEIHDFGDWVEKEINHQLDKINLNS